MFKTLWCVRAYRKTNTIFHCMKDWALQHIPALCKALFGKLCKSSKYVGVGRTFYGVGRTRVKFSDCTSDTDPALCIFWSTKNILVMIHISDIWGNIPCRHICWTFTGTSYLHFNPCTNLRKSEMYVRHQNVIFHFLEKFINFSIYPHHLYL